MPFQIKNWKLAMLAFFLMFCFIGLGIWQLARADQKKILLTAFTKRTQQAPLHANNLSSLSDKRFYRIALTGQFDNQHTLLLDNKTFHGKVGYEVYTPFKAQGISTPILIDRGFIPIGNSRNQLPVIKTLAGTVTLIGMINTPPTYVALGQISDSLSWPLRVQYIQTHELSKLIGYTLSPYIVAMSPQDIRTYSQEWQVVIMPPEKHIGYAIQWFALAFTLLILFVALNCRPVIRGKL